MVVDMEEENIFLLYSSGDEYKSNFSFYLHFNVENEYKNIALYASLFIKEVLVQELYLTREHHRT